MKKTPFLLILVFLAACAGGTQAFTATPEIENKEVISTQTQALPTATIAPTAKPAEPLPGKEVIPIGSMAKEIPWLPLNEKAIPVTTFIGINSSVPPFDNPLVRKAFSQAIDRQRICDGDKSRGRDSSVPATTFIPAQVLGRDLYQAVGLDYNPESAKKALADAGFLDISKFPKVEIVFYEGSTDLIKAYQGMWKSVLGIEVTLVPVKSGEELYKYIADKKPGLFILGTWIADYIDPQNFTYDSFLSPDTNYPKLVDPKFEELITSAKAAVDTPLERQRLYIEAEKILCADGVYVIPVTHAFISK
jgi:oligopeptide transport system substrate-binding protein